MTGSISRRSLIAAAPTLMVAADALAQSLDQLNGASVGMRLQAGVHRIDRDTTITGDVALDPGAQILVAAGRTLKLLGSFSAPVSAVFTGAGRVLLAEGRTLEAYPEWWGAKGESGEDCVSALEACLAAHPVTRLGPHSYYLSRTLHIDQSNRRLIGSGQRWLGAGTGTRLVLTGAGDVLRIGAKRRPGNFNDYPQGIMVSDLQLTRARAGAGAGYDASAGLRLRYALFADVSRVDSSENIIGFAIGGVVRTYLRDCSAFRSPGGGSGGIFVGYWLNGDEEIGAAGGNASVYLVDCNARTGGPLSLGDSVGAWLDGAFADTLFTNFETSAIATGMRLSGRATQQGSGKRRSGFADVRIQAPVLDQVTTVGIEIVDTSDHTLIELSDAYIASAPRSGAAMRFSRVLGQTTIRGGQLIGWTGPDAIGIRADDSEGLDFGGTKLLGYRSPARFTRCRDLHLGLAINLPDGRSAGPAVELTDCAEAIVAARVKGAASAYPAGVQVTGAASRAIAVDGAAIRAETVGGEARRVLWSGTPSGAVVIR